MKKLFCVILLWGAGLVAPFLAFSQNREYWPTKGWESRLPEQAGMDTAFLAAMNQVILSSMSYVDAFLIVKDGYLVHEEYYNGYNSDKIHHLWSATKSVTNIMMGIMFRKNYLNDLNLKIIDYFPEYSQLNADQRVKDITLEHLMTFTAGLYSSDNEAYSSSSVDALEYYLGNRFLSDPGSTFKYATPASHLQSALISKLLKMTEKELAEKELFPKLGITNYDWITDVVGYTYGGHNSYFCPRDMLKFGFLYLNRGIWNGDTLVEPEFVDWSTKVHSNGGTPHNEKYGCNWWVTTNNGYDAYFAGGYGGQFIYVVPALDLVVAITCNSDRHRENARFLINSYVVPSILKGNSIQRIQKGSGNRIRINSESSGRGYRVYLDIKEPTAVELSLSDVSGRIVTQLASRQMLGSGTHSYEFYFSQRPGVYYVIAQTDTGKLIEKCIIRQ